MVIVPPRKVVRKQRSRLPSKCEDLVMNYGSYVVMRDINFTVQPGQILVIMGGSGCGKSTLLKYLIGLKPGRERGNLLPWSELCESDRGRTTRNPKIVWRLVPRRRTMEHSNAGENVALPLEEYTKLSDDEIRELSSLKLALVLVPRRRTMEHSNAG